MTTDQFFNALAILDKLDDTPLAQADFHPNAFKKIEKATNKILMAMGSKYRVEAVVLGPRESIRSAVIRQLKRVAKNL